MTLKNWLEEQGLTQAEFAEMIQCRQQTVSRYVNGLQIPHRIIMRRIIAVTDGQIGLADFYVPQDEAA